MTTASLENTYWRLTRMGEQPVPVARAAGQTQELLEPVRQVAGKLTELRVQLKKLREGGESSEKGS